MAEIGVYSGCTTTDYIQTIVDNNGHCYLVDWFKGSETFISPGTPHAYAPELADSVYEILKDKFNPTYGLYNDITRNFMGNGNQYSR